jgi:hypothetical protein
LENLKDVPEIVLPINTFNSDWLAIPFMAKERMALLTFLEENNIQEPLGESNQESQTQEVDNRFSKDKFKAFQRNFKQRKPILNNK